MSHSVIRRAVAVVSALALGLTGAVVAVQPAAAATNLVAHYPLNETSGTTAVDVSGAGRNATYVGSPALTGAEGARLDGVDDHVKLPNDLLAGLTSITVSTDVLIRSAQSGAYFIYGFGNTDAGGAGNGYLFSSGNSYRSSIATGNWSTEQTVNSGANLTRDVWKTITYTLDDATDTARVYLDGVQVGVQTGVTITPASIGGGATAANYIGRSVYNADRTLSGSVRDFRVYNTALTAAEVLALQDAVDPGDNGRAQQDLDAITIANPTDIRGNVTLPLTGAAHKSAITWTSSKPATISATAQGKKAAGVVTRGATDTAVTLTAQVAGTNAQRTIAVTVKAAPAGLDTDYTAGYLWTHFAVEGGYEKIFYGYSDDGLKWKKLNENKSILANLAGDLGVRDPHLVRAPEGDKYFLIGTDLHAEGGGPGGTGWDQLNASKNVVVWESTDLVNWSDQRIVFAGLDDAGCVWAPEATYNAETGEYYVYYSARDRTDVNTNDWALRVYLTKTRDFVTFTEPEVWASLNEQGDGAGGRSIIDSTIAKEGDTYYRFSTSDWATVVDTATSLDGPWTSKIKAGEAPSRGLRESMEGLTVYQLPSGKWAVMGDQDQYFAQTADTLSSLSFTQLSAGSGANQYSFDQKFRHGSVLRLSAAEEARLLAAYGDKPVVPETPQQAPIAEYTFDDGTLADSVGNADLTASGTAAVATDAVKGKALRLDGTTNGFASFPAGFFDGRSTMTVSMDVKSERNDGNFFSFALGKDSNKYYFTRVRGGEIRSAITQGSWQAESVVTGNVTADAWHRVDVVFDGTSMSVYSDGIMLGKNTTLGATVAQLGSDLSGYLGKSFYAGDAYFKGWFDNIRVYNRALPGAEIAGNAGVVDQLMDVSLADPSVLKVAPIVNGTTRTAILPVKKGTNVSALAPTFVAPAGVTVSPASGTVVNLSAPVTYTLTAPGGSTSTWKIEAKIVGSPVLEGLNADPNIAVFGDTYYIYATSDGFEGWGGKTFYVWSSKNLVDWTRSAEPFLTLDGANGNVPWAVGNAWAPTITERGGKYYFYFSGHNAALDRKTIGVAVADSPMGPFVAQPNAMILNNEAVTSGQAIDPAAFHDPVTGKYYLGWGNGSPVLAELNDDMVSIKAGSYQRINGLTDFREGVFFNYRAGLYHLTYAIDDTGSEDYRVGYATATSMNGPWTYRGVILKKDLALGIKGPGHSSIINVPGTDDWYIAYHRFAIPGGNGNNRETTIDKVTFGADGLMQAVVPTLESVKAQPVVVTPVGPDVAAVASARCVAGKVVLTVKTDNRSAAPVSVRVETAYGSKTTASVDAGKSVSGAFSTRTANVASGTVKVTATSGTGATATSSVVQVSYTGLRCG